MPFDELPNVLISQSGAAMIRAGTEAEARAGSGQWVIVDMGFARASTKSCGVWVEGMDEPSVLNFGQMCERVVALAQGEGEPLNLVIEAPLSIAFDNQNNPVGREIEFLGSQRRFWYVGLGATVMVAAGYLLREIIESSPVREIRLFEGFVSFKPKGPSDHAKDVRALKRVIYDPDAKTGRVEIPSSANSEVQVVSAFKVFGMDFGVPPVIFVNPI